MKANRSNSNKSKCSTFWPLWEFEPGSKANLLWSIWRWFSLQKDITSHLITSKHVFHYLVEKSKALPASVVITISWPYLRAKVFISSGCDTDGLRENISEEMTGGGMSWESQQCVSSPSMPLPMRPWTLQVVSVLY